MKYDCIIIGGGMSGLAAAIRLAHFGQKVCVCEHHNRLGGLNSWYTKSGIEIDSGLHAMTNFASKTSPKALPLMKLLRQLRIPHDSLGLREQIGSKISFQEKTINFSNEFQLMQSEIASAFPNEIDNFNSLDQYIREYDSLNVTASYISAKKVINEKLNNPLLAEMIFCPLMYYGSAVEDDIDFAQFAIMYKSIFHEGFCRPGDGIKKLLNILKDRFIECGGEIINCKSTSALPDKVIALNCGIRKIITKNEVVAAVELSDGRILETTKILSSAGFPETLELIENSSNKKENYGQLSFVETVLLIDPQLNKQTIPSIDSTIIFFNESANFAYRQPENPIDTNSGVICCPNNFHFKSDDKTIPQQIRVTMLANHQKWFNATNDDYKTMKQFVANTAIKKASHYSNINNLSDMVTMTDVFTPKTIKRFTNHINGAIYGSPNKQKSGLTSYKNLFLCGTDQGFLGITGAMLSGISMANMHILRNK